MSDTSIAIKIAGEEPQNHVSAARWTSDDEAWIKQLSDSKRSVRIRIPADADTEGRKSLMAVAVHIAADDDDTEGHALSLHFPSAQEASDFRRRMLAAGLITATVAVGAAGGASLGSAISGITGSDAAAVSGQYNPANLGGTPLAAQQEASLGQANAANLGGTRASEASLGQANAANLGGTRASEASLGQANAANLGGTRASEASLGQANPANLGGTRASEASLGQANPANPGGTPASPDSEEE